ncbi:hypothetical protein IMSHALPRED_007460 [Imshaugia aleurites]|uniref:Uncharacterized protein n=1 Tax=Imshaugia aleurites TaxID=172621 RepID=A0A8H3FLY4_9LECA|nr:hypothetical protein IMSHALPRED_007460 [Imshaugia aleurites]
MTRTTITDIHITIIRNLEDLILELLLVPHEMQDLLIVAAPVIRREMRDPFLELVLVTRKTYLFVPDISHLDLSLLGLLCDTSHGVSLLGDMSHLLPVAGRLLGVDRVLLLRIKVALVIVITLDIMVTPATQDPDLGLGAVRGRPMSVGTAILRNLSIAVGSRVCSVVDEGCKQPLSILLANIGAADASKDPQPLA